MLKIFFIFSTLFFSQAFAASGLYELSGIDENLPFQELRPIKTVIGGSKFVALGESTHTSGGFYQAKLRLVRFLVEEMGFRSIAWEDDRGATEKISEYIKTCSGNPKDAIAPLYLVWQDTTMLKLLDYLCDYNRFHPSDPVYFYGFDVQDPFYSKSELQRLMKLHFPKLESKFTDPLNRCLGLNYEDRRKWAASGEMEKYFSGALKVSPGEYQDCLTAITKFEDFAKTIGELGSHQFMSWALVSLKSLRGWEGQMYYLGSPNPYTLRDESMAYALMEIRRLKFPTAKTIIWAHNFHITKRGETVQGWNAKMMGGFLSEKLGNDYVPIALTGFNVKVNWPHMNGPVPKIPTDSNSVEVMIKKAGYRYAFLDLEQSFLKPSQSYLLQSNDQYYLQNPLEQFRGILYLEDSPAMTYVGP